MVYQLVYKISAVGSQINIYDVEVDIKELVWGWAALFDDRFLTSIVLALA